ncbi:carbonic anhydrase [Candidatus Dependentiae bacterium]|nr:carbonic anhydrase [Candidatus Dependentiae bacterium]
MLYDEIDSKLQERESWVLRRQLGIPNNKRLFVLACMDERLPVLEALGINEGDAHIFRNAGGLVTDDAIRSAMLTTQFFGTQEIIIINHTECGMMTATGEYLAEALKKRNIDIGTEVLNPGLPELNLSDQKKNFAKWIQMFENVDAISEQQVKLFKQSKLIPKNIVINSYIWEVETKSLRKPHIRLSEKVNTSQEMSGSKACSKCGCLHLEEKKCQCPVK